MYSREVKFEMSRVWMCSSHSRIVNVNFYIVYYRLKHVFGQSILYVMNI